MKNRSAHLLVLCAAALLGGCGNEAVPRSFQDPSEVTLVIGISGGGSTDPVAGSWVYPLLEVVELQATPVEGFEFVRWSGDVESVEANTTILMDRDLLITAEFAPAAAARPTFFLPWAAGRTRTIGQANNGSFSHADTFAWDIPMPVGTPVLAVATGRVVDMLDSSLRNQAGSTEFAQPANFVTIDHGQGMQSLYAHLDFQGVTVAAGQYVVRGQVIGFSGNTGQSTAPHLHYEVLDVTGASVSTGFFEADAADGIPVEGDMLTSRNTLSLDSIETYAPSTLPTDAFLRNGIELFGPTPPAFFYTNETDYSISGRVLDAKSLVCLALVEPDSSETIFCDLADVGEDGRFTIPFRFTGELVGRHFLGVISGDGGAEGVTPISVLISPPTGERTRPTAVIDAPADVSVDYLQTRPLIGSGSFLEQDADLSYRWMQTSGPPVTIADETAAFAEFTVELGAGINRVSLQLVVFDGTLHSLPAQIDFVLPDTFFVSRIGIASTLCQTADTCPVFDPPPPLVTFSTDVILGWVELVNAEPDDLLSYHLIDPLEGEVRSSELTAVSEPETISFWRFPMSSIGLDMTPGLWTAVFQRNGEPEASLDFRVTP